MAHDIVSLFTGAGGLDLGMEAAGFRTRVCVEVNPECCVTLRSNRDWAVLEEDILEVSGRKLLKFGGLKRGSIGLLVGGPPCQPFSKSGFWKNGTTLRMNDPRANTLREYFRILRETLPQAFLLENVPGFAYEGRSDGLSFFLRKLKQLNRECKTQYSLSWKILNAANFGVPQRRERLFIIGCKDGTAFQFPKETHSPDAGPNQYLTAWDAIGDLEHAADIERFQLRGRWAKLISSIPEGKNYLWHTERGGGKPIFEWRSRYWNFLLKLSRKQPSWTIQASPGPATGPFHWRNRRLTEHEQRRLQTFPDDYKVIGNERISQRQIGNAVPPAMAEILGLEIRRQIFGERVRRNSILIPRIRLPGDS